MPIMNSGPKVERKRSMHVVRAALKTTHSSHSYNRQAQTEMTDMCGRANCRAPAEQHWQQGAGDASSRLSGKPRRQLHYCKTVTRSARRGRGGTPPPPPPEDACPVRLRAVRGGAGRARGVKKEEPSMHN